MRIPKLTHFTLTLLLLLGTLSPLAAQKMRIQGMISDDSKRPLPGALVLDPANQEVLGAADDDGNWSVYAEPKATLRFESIGCESRDLKINNRQTFNVTLKVEAVRLNEVQIIAKVTNKIIPEPTDIEVKGNYFHLRTRFRVPAELFKTNTRLIIQNSLYDVTTRKRIMLRPMVLDGHTYTAAQNRMYDFDLSRDPLSPYLFPHRPGKDQELIPYHDSVYIANPDHDFRADVLMSLENFRRVLYTDSFAIAKGTVNPLRFFRYDLATLELNDPAYNPQPAMQLCNDRGEIQLNFRTGESTLDLSDATNASELEQLYARLREIERDPDAKLQSFRIAGSASPEGKYETNVTLSRKRMQHASELILKSLTQSTRNEIQVTSEAHVESWESVVKMMERDTLYDEANRISGILARHKTPNEQFTLIRALPFYRTLIVERYLPRLRRVEYLFEYSLFRVLNDEEIARLHAEDPKKLSRYEYWRMMEQVTDTAHLRTLYEQALYQYPTFTLAANRLAILNLKQRRPDVELLRPFLGKNAPIELMANHAITCLGAKQFFEADSVMNLLPHTPQTEDIRAVVSVLNGDLESGSERIMAQGGLNEVLLLLARKENDRAWEKASALSTDVALHEYVKAIAANRLDKVMQALMHIENAIDMDPYLKEVAKIDGDVLDLLE